MFEASPNYGAKAKVDSYRLTAQELNRQAILPTSISLLFVHFIQ